MEYRYGESDAFRGGAFLPVNTAEVLPLGASKEFVVTSIYLTQRFGELGSLLLGKIAVVDLLAADPFFGGWGILRFMNVAFVAPPTGCFLR
jgi:porin